MVIVAGLIQQLPLASATQPGLLTVVRLPRAVEFAVASVRLLAWVIALVRLNLRSC